MPETTQAALVLLSGGMDSSTLLYFVARELTRHPVYALSAHYGQRHARELECARWQAAAIGVTEHQVIDLSFLGPLLRMGSALIDGGAPVPDLTDVPPEDRSQPPTYVPNRNMLLLALAAACAEARGVCDVFYGAQAQDAYGYWDCTRDFLERINAVLTLNRRHPVCIHAPFVDKSKAEIVAIGARLGVDFAHTWTCYRGGDRACGRCPACIERLNAFRSAAIPDPIPYENKRH